MTKDEADQMLAKAIFDHAIAYEMCKPEEEMLDQYAVIASWTPTVERGGSRYTTAYYKEFVPTHIAMGLFQVGLGLADDLDEFGNPED